MARMYVSCVSCGVTDNKNNMLRLEVLNRGNRSGFICERCANYEANYSDKNRNTSGSEKSELWTCATEFETSGATERGQAHLMSWKFLPSHDCSVWREYKSPIFNGFGSLVHLCKSLDNLLRDGDISIDEDCGTHLHIGKKEIVNHITGEIYHLNAEALDMLFKYRSELLTPLCDYLTNHPRETEEIFGRRVNHWCAHVREIEQYSYREEHSARYCAINFCSSTDCTIEYRLNFFRSGKQYARLIMLEKKMTEALFVNFLDYWQTGDRDEALAHQAVKAGNKLLRLMEKEVEKIGM